MVFAWLTKCGYFNHLAGLASLACCFCERSQGKTTILLRSLQVEVLGAFKMTLALTLHTADDDGTRVPRKGTATKFECTASKLVDTPTGVVR